MKKITLWKSFFLLFALIVGSTSAWGADETETITFSDIYGSPSSHINVNNVTFNEDNGGLTNSTIVFKTASGSNSPQYNKSDKVIQFYKNNTMTITSTKYIKSISCEISSSIYTGSNISVSETTYSCAITNKTTLNITNSTASYATTFVVTNGENGQVKIKSMTITYATPVISADNVNIASDVLAGNIAYDITYPDGSTLTAAKKSGDWLTVGAVDSENKRVAFSATENTGTAREAVVTLTYGAVTKDVTITQAAAATKYAVTFTAPSNGTLVIKRGDDAISSGVEVSEGTTLTIVATPNDGYNFDKWEYSVNGGTSWNEGVGTTYEVTSAVEIRASFIAKVYKNITWSIDGVETIQAVEVGTAIDFSRTATAPNGYSFEGWKATEIDGTEAIAPSYVTEATCSTDATYYAVFAKINVNEEEVIKSYGFETSSDEDWTISGPARSSESHNTGSYSGKINTNNSYVTFNDKVKLTSFSFAFTRASNNNNYYVYIETSTDNKTWTSAATYSMSTFNDDGTYQTKEKTFDGNTALYVRFHCYNTTAVRYVDDLTIKYIGETISYSDYCTSIPAAVVTIPTSGYATLSDTHGLDFANATDASDNKTLKAYVIPSNDGAKLSLVEKAEAPAGTGILLKGTAGLTYSIPVKANAAEVGSNLLKAGPTTVPDGNETIYLLKSGQFHLATAGTTSAGKAYLELPSAIGARDLTFSFGNETTGINNVEVNANLDTNAPMYNLAGQRVTKSYKGVVIANGKKMLNK